MSRRGFDDKILGMYARGMSVRDVQAQLSELYETDVFPNLISSVTDEVFGEVQVWQARPRLADAGTRERDGRARHADPGTREAEGCARLADAGLREGDGRTHHVDASTREADWRARPAEAGTPEAYGRARRVDAGSHEP